MLNLPWSTRFSEPVPLPDGTSIVTLSDAREYILNLPEAEQDVEQWQTAVFNLLPAAEHGGLWLELARIAMMQALNRHVEKVFRSRKTRPPLKRLPKS